MANTENVFDDEIILNISQFCQAKNAWAIINEALILHVDKMLL